MQVTMKGNKHNHVSIVDDHEIVRQGLAELLASMGVQVDNMFSDGPSFLNHLDKHVADQNTIYLIDYSMPRMDGVEVIKQVCDRHPDVKLIMLTQHLSDELKIEAYEAGARAFLNKTCSAEELRTTIDTVAQFGYHNFEEILRLLRTKRTLEEARKNPEVQLTDRELQFLEMVCDSGEYTYQQIADRMNLSVKSIDACRAGLFEKLGVRSKVGLVLYSFHHKLTAPFS
jgi:DNA-binding NarL/FixJ family response regulator